MDTFPYAWNRRLSYTRRAWDLRHRNLGESHGFTWIRRPYSRKTSKDVTIWTRRTNSLRPWSHWTRKRRLTRNWPRFNWRWCRDGRNIFERIRARNSIHAFRYRCRQKTGRRERSSLNNFSPRHWRLRSSDRGPQTLAKVSSTVDCPCQGRLRKAHGIYRPLCQGLSRQGTGSVARRLHGSFDAWILGEPKPIHRPPKQQNHELLG